MPVASERFAHHVVSTRYESLPGDPIEHAKVFILDSLGVGISGSTADGAEPLLRAASRWGSGEEALVWGTGRRAPATTAALVNAFQIHCQEFDCVHEGAVLHPMATLLPAALAYAERAGGISGRELLVAVATGVDVSTTLGVASKAPLVFFRPATAGGFGAAAAVGRLAGLSERQMVHGFGIQYAQTSGTMQPHVEGSVVLPMQVAFNARAAVQSCDMVAAGIPGPIDTFEGPFGYMRVMEGQWDLEPGLTKLGREWQISQVSHKPFPSGRAGNGLIEGMMRFIAERPFAKDAIESIVVSGPPLINRLCARPDLPAPNGNYARLCAAFIGAKVLQNDRIGLEHYRGEELTDARTHELARLFSMQVDDNPDPNALVPHEVVIRAKDGAEWRWLCEAMLASPSRRLSREQHLAKFRTCCTFAAKPLANATVDRLIAAVDGLETMTDVRDLVAILADQ
ncbi:MmgE/PrpD family protein [Lichenifustis flavocetrariae]|uniref:MmgE/PrpD family protein n=1 Tax=Lichenifustis flavocetrariae TaxID=2949735 RepID=A0AA42CRK1_9HYPH|nr:MmgE/PrpD family protein [Lichenifustis flavocetrariae]MCW6512560.1 MmgE/PrpD family protein [Lichenifustis flavocetrariae]